MQWPWSGPKPDPELEQRVSRLEGRMKSIEVEWDEWFDKYRRLYARLAKRVQQQREDDETASQDAPGPLFSHQAGVGVPSQSAHLAARFRRR